jgi:cytochrome c-type protein NapB
MFKKFIFPIAIISIFFVGCINLSQFQGQKKSDTLTTNISLEKIKQLNKKPQKDMVFERRFQNIPPVISHSITNMNEITKSENSCLTCHTPTKKKLASHFTLVEIKPNLYNCLSCHTQSN